MLRQVSSILYELPYCSLSCRIIKLADSIKNLLAVLFIVLPALLFLLFFLQLLLFFF